MITDVIHADSQLPNTKPITNPNPNTTTRHLAHHFICTGDELTVFQILGSASSVVYVHMERHGYQSSFCRIKLLCSLLTELWCLQKNKS